MARSDDLCTRFVVNLPIPEESGEDEEGTDPQKQSGLGHPFKGKAISFTAPWIKSNKGKSAKENSREENAKESEDLAEGQNPKK